MRLIIVHYHLRPGGVRKVIESATPFLLREMPEISRVVVATGEARDVEWNVAFQRSCAPVPVEWFVDPALRYVSEQRVLAMLGRRIRSALKPLLAGDGEACVWAQNLSVARNLPLASELVRACELRKIPLLLHHHDWWFDNRWLRWPEMQRTGFHTLRAAAEAVLPRASVVRFATINRADATVLRRHFGSRAGWLPNPSPRSSIPTAVRIRRAREWLRELVGGDAPVWLLPCRLLRRKNVAEALLLTRWLRPGATLVVTGGASSADEIPYAEKLLTTAREQGWPMIAGALDGSDAGRPSVAELMAASECVLLTSIQEGFGFPFLEAAASARSLIARRLPNIAPDLAKFGFAFPQCYRDVWIAPALFDWSAETRRQRMLFREWKAVLPPACRGRCEPLPLQRNSRLRPLAFSRLTLAGQLEVLAHQAEESWKMCAPLNSLLVEWKALAASQMLQAAPWPASAERWLGGGAYARRLADMLRRIPSRMVGRDAGLAVQEDFIREKLRAPHVFPLLCQRGS